MQPYSVLIETLWNVKSSNLFEQIKTRFSINRNIVECKEQFWFVWLGFFNRINRNIVECKVYMVSESLPESCINRNIVECKACIDLPASVLDECINRNIVECKENRTLKIQ